MNAIESINLSSTSQHERELTVTIASDVVKQEFEVAISNKQKMAARPGFRPGKMPKNMVLSYYGPEIKEHLAEKLMDKSFDEACKKENLIPVSRPRMEKVGAIETEKAFTYKAFFQVMPTVCADNYAGLNITLKQHTFSEQDVDDELKSFSEAQATFVEPKDRDSIQECDLVQCDSDVKIEGELNKDYSHNDYSVPLFAPNVPADLRAALIGKKVGDIASVEYDMPSEHQDAVISGKKCEMILTIKSFKERVIPKLDDEFAKDLSDKFSSLADLKDSIRLRFNITAKRRDEYFRQDAITKALVEANPCDVPPAMVEQTALSLINRELQSMEKKAAQEIANKHWQELWNSVQDRALFRTKYELLVLELVEKLGIKASDEEVAMRVEKVKEISKEDAAYSIQFDKLLDVIEKGAHITKIEEPLFPKA